MRGAAALGGRNRNVEVGEQVCPGRHGCCPSRTDGHPAALEERMARWNRIVPAFAVALVLAACSAGSSDTPLSPAAPHFDGSGGGTTLGGNATGPGDPGTSTTTNTAASDSTAKTGGTTLGGN